MTKAELQKALTKKGIDFPKSAGKKELEQLLNPAAPAAPGAKGEDPHITSANKGPVHPAAASKAEQNSKHIVSALNGPVHEANGKKRVGMDIHGRPV